LALGKSISEVRALPVEEFESWQLFYMIEPWGWNDEEYRTGATLAMLNNVNASKKKYLKKEADYMRDMPNLIAKAYRDIGTKDKMRDKLLKMSIEERRKMIAKVFGKMVKEVKIGNSSNNSS